MGSNIFQTYNELVYIYSHQMTSIFRNSIFHLMKIDSSVIYCETDVLRSDIEYKTLIVNNQTTCRDLIWMLLSKYRMRHRDPKLFYLTMDIYIKRTGIPLKRTLTLEDEARPAELKSCHPWGECKFTLQMRKGTVALKSV